MALSAERALRSHAWVLPNSRAPSSTFGPALSARESAREVQLTPDAAPDAALEGVGKGADMSGGAAAVEADALNASDWSARALSPDMTTIADVDAFAAKAALYARRHAATSRLVREITGAHNGAPPRAALTPRTYNDHGFHFQCLNHPRCLAYQATQQQQSCLQLTATACAAQAPRRRSCSATSSCSPTRSTRRAASLHSSGCSLARSTCAARRAASAAARCALKSRIGRASALPSAGVASPPSCGKRYATRSAKVARVRRRASHHPTPYRPWRQLTTHKKSNMLLPEALSRSGRASGGGTAVRSNSGSTCHLRFRPFPCGCASGGRYTSELTSRNSFTYRLSAVRATGPTALRCVASFMGHGVAYGSMIVQSRKVLSRLPPKPMLCLALLCFILIESNPCALVEPLEV